MASSFYTMWCNLQADLNILMEYTLFICFFYAFSISSEFSYMRWVEPNLAEIGGIHGPRILVYHLAN